MSEAGSQQVANDGAPAAAARSFAERFIGALRLDGSVYEEVASDPGAIGQAAGVAASAALARGAVDLSMTASGQATFNTLYVLAIWPIVALLVWGVGHLLRLPGEFGRILRATGFAMAPMVLIALGLVPNEWFGIVVSLVSLALFFGALVVGVREALRIDTGRSALVCVIVGLGFVLSSLIVKYVTFQLAGSQ